MMLAMLFLTTWLDSLLGSTIWLNIYTFWSSTWGQIYIMSIAGSLGATVFIGGLALIVVISLYNLAVTGGRSFAR